MNQCDWLMLMCLFCGISQGVWLGWYIWRKPQLTEKK